MEKRISIPEGKGYCWANDLRIKWMGNLKLDKFMSEAEQRKYRQIQIFDEFKQVEPTDAAYFLSKVQSSITEPEYSFVELTFLKEEWLPKWEGDRLDYSWQLVWRHYLSIAPKDMNSRLKELNKKTIEFLKERANKVLDDKMVLLDEERINSEEEVRRFMANNNSLLINKDYPICMYYYDKRTNQGEVNNQMFAFNPDFYPIISNLVNYRLSNPHLTMREAMEQVINQPSIEQENLLNQR